MSGRAIGLAPAALLCAGAVAFADRAHPSVKLEVDACVQAPAADVRRVVAIELGALLVDDPAVGGDLTRVQVGCVGALVELRVADPITGKSLARTVDLEATAPPARARLLALAVVELISASWTELEVNPEPQVPPASSFITFFCDGGADRDLPMQCSNRESPTILRPQGLETCA